MEGSHAIPTVMLVDDDDVDLMQSRRQLEAKGRFGQIFAYERPEDALLHLADDRKPPIDVLLLDMKMPTMSGFQFLEQAATELGPDYVGSVIILTTLSLAEMHLRRATDDRAVRAYLQKPLEERDVERVLKIVEAARAEAALTRRRPADPRGDGRSEQASA